MPRRKLRGEASAVLGEPLLWPSRPGTRPPNRFNYRNHGPDWLQAAQARTTRQAPEVRRRATAQIKPPQLRQVREKPLRHPHVPHGQVADFPELVDSLGAETVMRNPHRAIGPDRPARWVPIRWHRVIVGASVRTPRNSVVS